MAKDKDKPEPKRYKSSKMKARPDFEFTATFLDEERDLVAVRARGRHLFYHEHRGIDQEVMGKTRPEYDPTGKQSLEEARTRLGRVLTGLFDLDPDEFPGGEITDKAALERFVSADENADCVMALSVAYGMEADSPRRKSGDARSGEARPGAQGGSQATAGGA